MRLELQILAAFLLDLLLGDPHWLPHPVRGIAWLAMRLESVTRRLLPSARLAGIVTALGTYAAAGGVAWGAIVLAKKVHPALGDAVAVLLIYTTIAARDLAGHSAAVARPLAQGDLAEARKRVGMIVGRDVEELDEAEVSRAAVESVAESTVDGVTAPLLFAMVAGPVGAVVYRAINTLDSLFGHKDERYIAFGWAAARIDDVANYVPARLTAPLLCAAAALLGEHGGRAWRTWRRDGRNHESPNSGLTEAAMAGALGVQLGGTNYYEGVACPKPTIGDAVAPLSWRHIARANTLMLLTTALFLGVGLIARWSLASHAWRMRGGL